MTELEHEVLRLRSIEKLEYTEIARRLGLPEAQLRRAYDAARKKQTHSARFNVHSLRDLPGYLRTLIALLGINSREEARALLESGSLTMSEKSPKQVLKDGQPVGNAGWAAWMLVHEWVGLPVSPDARRPKGQPPAPEA
jgi:hypothetical protein